MSKKYEDGLPKKYRHYEDPYKSGQRPDFYERKLDRPNVLVTNFMAGARYLARKTINLIF